MNAKTKNNQCKQRQESNVNLWKLSLLVLIISVGIYYLIKQKYNHAVPKSLRVFDEKIGEFIHETWHTFLWSKNAIHNKLFCHDDQHRFERILQQLLEAEQEVNVKKTSRIAVGLGVCTDLVVRALDVLGHFPPPTDSQPHDHIDNWNKFLELFAYYFQRGAASERYIESKDVFNKLIKLIDEKKVEKKEAIGSNAPLISLRFARENFQNILLGAQITEKLSKKLPKNIEISGPIIDQDDYHVILEYNINEQWNQYKSPRANRLIIHSDDNNVKLLSKNNFFKRLRTFKPDLLILSGLHMLDNSPIDFSIRTKVIEDFAKDLVEFRENYKAFRTHFEMSAYTEYRLLELVVNQVFPHIDSFGMNEQEANNLLSLMKFGNISYSANPFPRVAYVLDEMRELFAFLDSIGNGRVSRIHVHTLAYQVVMTRVDLQTNKPIWKSSKAAMAKASLTAYRFTCNLPEIDLKQVKILLDDSFATTTNAMNADRIELDKAIQCWQEDLNSPFTFNQTRVQICLAIGMVCTNVVQTVGAGDNISASGLMLQL